jgi:hypothetical protein
MYFYSLLPCLGCFIKFGLATGMLSLVPSRPNWIVIVELSCVDSDSGGQSYRYFVNPLCTSLLYFSS